MVVHNPLPLMISLTCSLLLPAVNATCHINSTVTNLMVDMCTGDNCLMEAFEAVGSTVTTGQNCFIVYISPGNHTITKSFIFTSNITIQAADHEQPTFVIFDMNKSFFGTHALLFTDASSVEVHGIQFIDEHSPGSIGFERITEVSITNSSFRWFRQGAVDIYNCLDIKISHSIFESNGPVPNSRMDQYRGNAGGVSIGYNNMNSNAATAAGIVIHDCIFRNNTSRPPTSLTVAQVFRAFTFPGRGGAVAILIDSLFKFDVSVTDCLVADNSVSKSGNGIFLVFTGHSAHTVTIDNSMFLRNTGSLSGTVTLAYFEATKNGELIQMNVLNCHFEGNSASYGGGVYLYAGSSNITEDVGVFENCTFKGNSAIESGSAIGLFSELLFDTDQSPTVQFNNCTFDRNHGGNGGVVTTGYLPLSFSGNNTFHNNSGRVLVVIGTSVRVDGTMQFSSNSDSGTVGSGAVHMVSFAQFVLIPGANLSFTNNTGVHIGAALVVDNEAAAPLPPSYRYAYRNPLCVLRYENSTLTNPDDATLTDHDPAQWEEVSIAFNRNKALLGPSIFATSLELCAFPTGNLNNVFKWNFIEFSDNNSTAHIPNGTSDKWYVETLPVNISVSTRPQLRAYPGEQIRINFTGLDELGRSTGSSIRLSRYPGEGILFTPSVAMSVLISNASIITKFAVTDEMYKLDETTVHVDALLTEVSTGTTFNITLDPCPTGYILENLSSDTNSTAMLECQCAVSINLDIITCHERKLIIQNGVWAATVLNSSTNKLNALFTYPCPERYCRHRCNFNERQNMLSCATAYTKEDQNKQCSCNREGVLCGRCVNGTGVSALLNECKECGYENIMITLALVLADVIVISVLLSLKVGPPLWLYPTLLYVQTYPILADSFRRDLSSHIQYEHYFGNGLSFYFAYDFCLFPELDPFWSYFLRYLPFLLTVPIAAGAILLRHCYKLKRVPWYGLWWMVLFQYIHVIHTSISILDCPELPDLDNGNLSHHWHVAANIVCFTGWHIGLALLAMFTLIFCMLLVPIIFIYSLEYLEKPLWLSMSIKPLSKWFKEGYSWWPAVELIRRLVLIFFAVLIPTIRTNYPVMIFLGLNLMVYSFVQPYRQNWYNYFDLCLTTNTLVLLICTNSKNRIILTGTESETSYNKSLFNDCSSDPVSPHWDILTFYYLPIVVFVSSSLVALTIVIWRYLSVQCETQDIEDDEDNVDASYALACDDEATTDFILTLPHGTLPVSRVMRQLNSSNHQLDTRSHRSNHTHYGKNRDKKTKRSRHRWSSHHTYTRYFKRKLARSSTRSADMDIEDHQLAVFKSKRQHPDPDDNLAGSQPPTDNLVGRQPPTDNLVGRQPPTDNLVGRQPPTDNLVGRQPLTDNLVRRHHSEGDLLGMQLPAVLEDDHVERQPLLVERQPPTGNLVERQPPTDNLVRRHSSAVLKGNPLGRPVSEGNFARRHHSTVSEGDRVVGRPLPTVLEEESLVGRKPPDRDSPSRLQ